MWHRVLSCMNVSQIQNVSTTGTVTNGTTTGLAAYSALASNCAGLVWRAARSRLDVLAESASQSAINIAGWFTFALRYLRYHSNVSWRLSHFLSATIWLVIKYINQITGLFSHSILLLLQRIFSFSESLTCLALLIIGIGVWKSLQPRYRLYELKPTIRRAKRKQKPISRSGAHVTPKTTQLTECNPNEWRLLKGLGAHYFESQRQCYGAMTLGEIFRVRRLLTWSSQAKCEFESVQWLNRTVQLAWPSVKTLVAKILAEISNPTTSAEQRRKQELAKAKAMADGQVKMSVYLSCRRQLDLLRRSRNKVLRRGDEFLGQKVVIMIVYFAKKLIICSRQYLMDHIRSVIALLSMNSGQDHAAKAAKPAREMEIDIRKLLKDNKIKVKKTGSGHSGGAGAKAKPYSQQSSVRTPRLYQTKSSSAPRLGISGKSCFTPSLRGLISAGSINKCRTKRHQLARKINRALEIAHDEKKSKAIAVELLELGMAIPKLKAIKYLDESDRSSWPFNFLSRNNIQPRSDLETMQIMLEIDYSSDEDFCLRLSSVPVLRNIELTKLDFRVRLMVTGNHDSFGNPEGNLDILEAPDGKTLLPILNYVQVTLVDVPQLDWQIRRVHKQNSARTRRTRRNALLRSPASSPENFVASMLHQIKRNLIPVNFINHSYFKYLVHWALGCVQLWLKPFDILIGDRVRLRTLN